MLKTPWKSESKHANFMKVESTTPLIVSVAGNNEVLIGEDLGQYCTSIDIPNGGGSGYCWCANFDGSRKHEHTAEPRFVTGYGQSNGLELRDGKTNKFIKKFDNHDCGGSPVGGAIWGNYIASGKSYKTPASSSSSSSPGDKVCLYRSSGDFELLATYPIHDNAKTVTAIALREISDPAARSSSSSKPQFVLAAGCANSCVAVLRFTEGEEQDPEVLYRCSSISPWTAKSQSASTVPAVRFGPTGRHVFFTHYEADFHVLDLALPNQETAPDVWQHTPLPFWDGTKFGTSADRAKTGFNVSSYSFECCHEPKSTFLAICGGSGGCVLVDYGAFVEASSDEVRKMFTNNVPFKALKEAGTMTIGVEIFNRDRHLVTGHLAQTFARIYEIETLTPLFEYRPSISKVPSTCTTPKEEDPTSFSKKVDGLYSVSFHAKSGRLAIGCSSKHILLFDLSGAQGLRTLWEDRRIVLLAELKGSEKNKIVSVFKTDWAVKTTVAMFL